MHYSLSRTRLPRCVCLLLLLACVGLALASCSGDREKPAPGGRRGEGAGMPVRAEPVLQGAYAVYFYGLGTVTANKTVTVRSRVDGEIMALHFAEGQHVQEGDLLAEIDPRPYQAELEQARGKLAQNEASLRNARRLLNRYKVLLPKDSASPQQVDAQEALVRQYEGAVRQVQGEIDAVTLQLRYCRVTAPVSGRLGLRNVDKGNIIRASDSAGLVVITQIRPITVVFTVTEAQLPTVREAMRKGNPIPVEAWDRSFSAMLAVGRLLTIDNQIDVATGTVKLKAEFDNADDALFPNQFVNARIRAATLEDALLAPTAAVQRGQKGYHAYTVGAGNIVELRQIEIGPFDNTATVITNGLQKDDLVVTDGVDRLRNGVRVDVIGKQRPE